MTEASTDPRGGTAFEFEPPPESPGSVSERPASFRRSRAVVIGFVLTLLTAACSATAVTTSPAPSRVVASPTAVTLQPSNPYYVAAQALSNAQVVAGTKIDGCTVIAFTNCAGADLSSQYLQGAFLAYSNLTGANLAGVDLLQADVAYATLDGADLTAARLSATSTTEASFAGAQMAGSQWVLVAGSQTNFSHADLAGANFTSAGLTSSDFQGADLSGVNFTLADLTGADLSGANLRGAVFCQTVMPDGTIRNPQPSASAAMNHCGHPVAGGHAPITIDDTNPYFPLALAYTTPFVPTGSTFGGCALRVHARCPGADLKHRIMTGIVAPYSRLPRADLSNANLVSLIMDDAAWNSAKLASITFYSGSAAGTDLKGADLSHAELSLSSFNGASLQGARLVGTNLDFGSVVGTDLAGADLRGVHLADSNANGANFTDADLRGANLSNADLTGATLTGADLQGAIFCNTLMPDASVRNPVNGLCPGQ